MVNPYCMSLKQAKKMFGLKKSLLKQLSCVSRNGNNCETILNELRRGDRKTFRSVIRKVDKKIEKWDKRMSQEREEDLIRSGISI